METAILNFINCAVNKLYIESNEILIFGFRKIDFLPCFRCRFTEISTFPTKNL